jgi:heme A synthase
MTIANTIGGLGLLALTASHAWPAYATIFCLCGLGFGLGWSFTNIGTQRVVPAEETGVAAGVAQTVVIVVAGVGIAVEATAVEVLVASGHSAGAAINLVLRVIALGLLASAGLLAVFGRGAR